MEQSTGVSFDRLSSWQDAFFPSKSIMAEANDLSKEMPGMDPYRDLDFSPVKARVDSYTVYSTDEEGDFRYTLSISAVALENFLHVRDDILSTSPFYLSGYTKIGLTALLGTVTTIVIGLGATVEAIARLGLAVLCTPLLLFSCFTDSACDPYALWFAKTALYNAIIIPSGLTAAYAMFTERKNFQEAEDLTTILNEASCHMEEMIVDRWIKI